MREPRFIKRAPGLYLSHRMPKVDQAIKKWEVQIRSSFPFQVAVLDHLCKYDR